MFFLARVRLVTARFLLRHFKHAFLASFIAAAKKTRIWDREPKVRNLS